MRQARWTEDSIELVEVEPPPLAPGHVRLAVRACGICGTDLHLLRRELPAPPGGVPGHEIVGTPLDGPADLADGLYAVEPRFWCSTCTQCVEGRHHLCESGGLFGVHRPGGLADFVDVPRTSLHRVDDDVPAEVAALAEPLAVCVRAVRLGEPGADSCVLVLGGGTIGLLTGLLARERARSVAVTTRHPQQRAAAERLGLQALGEDEVAAWAADAQPDVVIETVGGRAQTLLDAVRSCRAAGRVVVLGLFSHTPQIDGLGLMAKEITVVGSNTYGPGPRGSDYGAAVALLPRHAAELAPLQTHHFALEKLRDAFATAEDKRSGAIKVTLLPGGDL